MKYGKDCTSLNREHKSYLHGIVFFVRKKKEITIVSKGNILKISFISPQNENKIIIWFL